MEKEDERKKMEGERDDGKEVKGDKGDNKPKGTGVLEGEGAPHDSIPPQPYFHQQVLPPVTYGYPLTEWNAMHGAVQQQSFTYQHPYHHG